MDLFDSARLSGLIPLAIGTIVLALLNLSLWFPRTGRYRAKPVSDSMWCIEELCFCIIPYWSPVTSGYNEIKGGGLFGGTIYVGKTVYAHSEDEAKRLLAERVELDKDIKAHRRKERDSLKSQKTIFPERLK